MYIVDNEKENQDVYAKNAEIFLYAVRYELIYY